MAKGPGSVRHSPNELKHHLEPVRVPLGLNVGDDLVTLKGQDQVRDDGVVFPEDDGDPDELPDLSDQFVLLMLSTLGRNPFANDLAMWPNFL